MKHRWLHALGGGIAASCLALMAAGCGGAPQIIDYGPEKGATGVPTSSPIRVEFDRPVDRASVAERFSITPAADGRLTWPSSKQLLYVPEAPLQTDTTYRVLLRAGYSSQGGGASDLDHTWYFRTEGPLQVTDTSPAAGERGVDPAAYLEVSFNHRVNAGTLAAGFDLVPSVPLQASLAAGDPFRVVIAPAGLLAADTEYKLTVRSSVKDTDGNPLPGAAPLRFRTGPTRPLHGWITCLASPGGTAAAGGGDLWMVDQNRLPRELLAGPVTGFEWAPTADELTVEVSSRTWEDRRLDGTSARVPIPADRVVPLGGGHGFLYLDRGTLGLLSQAGDPTVLAQDVAVIALSPDGQQVVYTVPRVTGTELWAVNVELRSRYQLGAEPGVISELAWSPDSSHVAYQLVSTAGTSVRVRSLTGSVATTVAAGDVSSPAWDGDSAHLYLLATRGAPVAEHLFRIPTSSGLQTLAAGAALPTPAGLTAGPPEPSPDGHQVAFEGTDAHGDEVWLMNSDGTGLVRLTGGPAYDYSCRAPRWTPPA